MATTDTTSGASWSDWMQGVGSTLVNAKVASWQASQPPQSYDQYQNKYYPDGKPATSISSNSNMLLIIGGLAAVALIVVLVK